MKDLIEHVAHQLAHSSALERQHGNKNKASGLALIAFGMWKLKS